MIKSIFILSPTGEVLIERHFRGATSRSVCDFYWEKASASLAITGISTAVTSGGSTSVSSSHDSVPPILEVPMILREDESTSLLGGGGSGSSNSQDGTLYLFSILRDGLSYLAACPAEVSPLLVLELLHRVADIFQDYFGTPADEAAIRENFSTVYQLLEEMLDFGWPLTTEPNALKAMIRPSTVMNRIHEVVTGNSSSQVSSVLPGGCISNMPWRRSGVKYPNNEIYIDIIEEMDAIVDPNGRMISSDVSGHVKVQSRLSGVPDMLLTFKDPDVIDDCSFHPCVRYTRYENEKVVSFVPPDGNFELMRYRVRHQQMQNSNSSQNQLHHSKNYAISPPIICTPQFSYGEPLQHASSSNSASNNLPPNTGKCSITVGVRPINSLVFSSSVEKASRGRPHAVLLEDVVVTIPFPKAVKTANLQVTFGKVIYDEASKVAKWTIGKLDENKRRLGGLQQPQLTGTMVLDNTISRNSSSGHLNGGNTHGLRENNDHIHIEENPPLQLSWKVLLASVSGVSVSGLTLYGESYRPYKGVRNITRSGSFQIRCK